MVFLALLSRKGRSGFTVETYDIDLQHSLPLASWNDVVCGGGYRVMDDGVNVQTQLAF